jgi:pimeloyl-ACP methyl ester carboxylesterase
MHLLLLPGLDGTGRLFEPLLPLLRPALVPAVVAYPSDRPGGYEDLLPLVEAAVPEREEFLILGESFSGPLALLLAARHPPGLRGIILCAAFARSPFPTSLRWLRGLVHPWWFRAMPFALIRRVLLGRFDTVALGQLLRTAIATAHPAVLAARVRAVLAVDVSAALRVCSVPILYLAAREDRLVSLRSLAHIRRLKPQVDVRTLTGPHLLLQVSPAAAARAVLRFAASCAVAHQPGLCQPPRGGRGTSARQVRHSFLLATGPVPVEGALLHDRAPSQPCFSFSFSAS